MKIAAFLLVASLFTLELALEGAAQVKNAQDKDIAEVEQRLIE